MSNFFQPTPPPPIPEPITSIVMDTKRLLKATPVSSTAIEDYTYDTAEKTLEVRFQSGALYSYIVPRSLFTQFKYASSRGRFFMEHIRDKYPTAKLEAAQKDELCEECGAPSIGFMGDAFLCKKHMLKYGGPGMPKWVHDAKHADHNQDDHGNWADDTPPWRRMPSPRRFDLNGNTVVAAPRIQDYIEKNNLRPTASRFTKPFDDIGMDANGSNRFTRHVLTNPVDTGLLNIHSEVPGIATGNIDIFHDGQEALMHVGSVTVEPEHQGKKIGTQIAQGYYMGAKQSQAEFKKPLRLEFQANLDVGGYAWAASGKAQFDERFERPAEFAKRLNDTLGQMEGPDKAFNALDDGISYFKDTADISQLPHIGRDDASMLMTRPGREIGDLMYVPGLEAHAGKALLLGEMWNAKVEFGYE